MTRSNNKVRRGPGLIYILAALVIVGVAGAKFFGFAPGSSESPSDVGEERAVPEDSSRGGDTPRGAGGARVLVYHAHTTENYKGKRAHEDRAAGDVVHVGAALVDGLKRHGIEAVHIMTVHDLPNWDESTMKARQSVLEELDRHERIDVIVDIHRDAIPPGETSGYATVETDVGAFARMLFIVGTLDNEKAKQNVAYAESLKDYLEKDVSGITRGVRMLQQETNGDLMDRAVTVFIGDYEESDVEEAKRSAQLLADAIAHSLEAR